MLPNRGKSPLSCWFHRKKEARIECQKQRNKGTQKHKKRGAIHSVSLPLLFRTALKPSESFPESVTWYTRYAGLQASARTSSTRASTSGSRTTHLDYSAHASGIRPEKHITTLDLLSLLSLDLMGVSLPKIFDNTVSAPGDLSRPLSLPLPGPSSR